MAARVNASNNRLLIILALATLIRLPFVFLTPAWQAPDEYPHFHYIRTLAETGKFPISRPQFPDYEVYQPPLYYLIGAGLFQIASHDGVPPVPEDVSYIESDLPLVIIVLRLFSVILGVGTICLAYYVGQQIFSQNEFLALALPIMIALHPTFVSNTTSITNDALANLIGALLVWVLLHPIYRTNTTLVGISLGAAFLTKHNLLPFTLLAFFTVSPFENFDCEDFLNHKDTKHTKKKPSKLCGLCAFVVQFSATLWREKKAFIAWLQQALIIIVIALLVSGWYYLHNLRQYGNLLAINPGVETKFSALVWDGPRWLQVIRNYNWSFWCAFGRTYEIHLPAWLYLIFFLPFSLVVLYGAGRAVQLHFRAKRLFASDDLEKLSSSFPSRATTRFFLFGIFIYVVAALGYTASYPLNCAWGKYVFPFLIPIWVLMLSALHTAVGQKFLKFIVVFLAVSFIFMNGTMLWQLLRLQ